MIAGGERTLHVENLCLTRGMRSGRGLGAADLLAIDRNGELSVALPCILGDLQSQCIGPAADGDIYRRRIANCSAASESRIARRQTLGEAIGAAYQESTNG